MDFWTMTCSRILVVLYMCAAGSLLYAETYIVPFAATALPGSDGVWWTQVTAVNPNAFPVSLRVTRVFPFQSAYCGNCGDEPAEMTLQPFASRVIRPSSGSAERRLVAGAFEITSSGPLVIHAVAYRPGANEIRQTFDVARRWLSAGRHYVSAVERSPAWHVNVFVTNPGDESMIFSAWTRTRALNEVRVTVPPRSTAVISLPPPDCGNGPGSCPPDTGQYPPAPFRVEVEADREFLASVSVLASDWAVFSLADEARH